MDLLSLEYLRTAKADPQDPRGRINLMRTMQHTSQPVPVEVANEQYLLSLISQTGCREIVMEVFESRKDRFSSFMAQLPELACVAQAVHFHQDYNWLQQDEVPPPTAELAMYTLTAHLRTHPLHREAIREMNEPVVLLEPLFKPDEESAGFRRILNALDGRPGSQNSTYIRPVLQSRWNIPDEVSLGEGKIIGWSVVVMEGIKAASSEMFISICEHPLENQSDARLLQWEDRNRANGLHLPNRVRNLISNMSELLEDGGSGIDMNRHSRLEDPSQSSGSDPVYSTWLDNRVYLFENPQSQYESLILRTSVVVPFQNQ